MNMERKIIKDSLHDSDGQAIAWLEEFSRNLERDPELLQQLPIDEVRAELRDLGADVDSFPTELARRLNTAKLKKAGTALLQWASPLWRPQWAGQFVGAGDIPAQTHTFQLEDGAIEITCSWKIPSNDTPAYLDLAWRADTRLDGELWCRFVCPETGESVSELRLGSAREGGKYFTSQELGFKPSQEQWGLVILVKSFSSDV